ncbi:MAG: ribonuclease D, partial [Planctomycetes bacterium]|nr:ribonuclease D [Planctomycetota bacterium]
MPPRKTDQTELMVTDEKSLLDVCDTLRAAGTFGFDTEFIRERSYEPQLCLIQVAAGEMTAIIDPLAVDVGAFWELVVDGALTKVVHAGNQDLEICYLQTKRVPANIFDVQTAAAMVGMDYPLSYARLVQRVLSVSLTQTESYSEWAHRPLSASQLSYAVEDVAYLVALMEHFTAAIAAKGRQDWFAEEMALFENEELYLFDPP